MVSGTPSNVPLTLTSITSNNQERIVLRIRSISNVTRNRTVSFTPDTIDNEFLGKLSSKGKHHVILNFFLVCCIFHKENDNDDHNPTDEIESENGNDGIEPTNELELTNSFTNHEHSCQAHKKHSDYNWDDPASIPNSYERG